ncbi:MAG: hypothetical protein GX800_11215 [Clostridiaceae bacterium]|nr:hypothetical protein [Clostridiaceae bacterium]
MGERTNQGYKIIESIFVGKTEFVLGENPNGGSKYVTWKCKNGDDYYWGKYMDDFYAAKLDLYSRVSDEISYLQSIDALPPVPAQGDTEKPLNKPMIKKKHRHEPER